MPPKKLTHLNDKGSVHMVDVSGKPPLIREAVASGFIVLAKNTLRLIQNNKIKKGSVLTTAIIAGIQAGKKTSELIPLCHPLPLSHLDVKIVTGRSGKQSGLNIEAVARTIAGTGVEMEALTAVSVAALTLYDMCKAVDSTMEIRDVRLIKKTKLPIPPQS
ncbi:MAG: cyclic pyranopterin monophosphate synthase MoaC [Verrucomicrobiota bacterium]|nr:cyclic pyranopterin monophosphate synthase MoaC [Verrucomicrobiota bacterium]